MSDGATDLNSKRARLERVLKDLGSVAVAFSGGVDSTLVLAVARQVLGRDKVLAITAKGTLFAPNEATEAQDLASRLDIVHETIETHQLDLPHFRKNPPDRCYHCKKEILGPVFAIAKARGMATVCDGGNADDAGVWRPGTKAAAEMGVRSPLKEAGFTKADVRTLSKEMNLPTWDRPAMPCLSTRFPYGQPITAEALARVAAAESVVAKLGYSGFRVRDHGTVARIEVAPEDIARLVATDRERIVRGIKALGYAYVTVDLEGYRSGAMDEVISKGDL